MKHLKINLRLLPTGGYAILVLLLATSCSSSKKLMTSIDQTFESSPVFEQGFSGFALYDPQEQEMLYEFNSDKYFTPASNTKLYTFYTGLKILDDSLPGIHYTIRNDSLIFTATGDPSLLNPDLVPSTIPDFLKSRSEKLFYLSPTYVETPLGPGWAWDDYNAYYSVERSPFPVHGNKVIVNFRRDTLFPEIAPRFFKDSLFQDDRALQRVERHLHHNSFLFSNPEKTMEVQQEIPFRTSTEIAVKLLRNSLGRNIEVLNSNQEFFLDKTEYSIPSDSLYQRMLQESDNFLAEQILLMAAQEIADTLKTEIAIDYMKENFLEDLPDKLVWVDGSGLSRYNLTTPRNTIKLLQKIQDEVPYKKLFQLLPAGGATGTLKNQFHAAEPFVFAKTGTLSNNYSLSGYLLTKKGKILIFSFMNSNFVVPNSVLKREMEKIIRSIRNTY